MKKILKLFIPSSIIYLYQSFFSNTFRNYYLKNKSKFNFDNELKKMISFFIQSKSYDFISKKWENINIKFLKQIQEKKLENYGTTLSRKYFTFIECRDDQVKETMLNVQNISMQDKVNLFKKQNDMSFIDSMKFNNLTYLLYQNLKKLKLIDKLNYLSDKGYLSFNDPFIEINEHKISQDKINSIFDYENINKVSPFCDKKKILEIGAGSGRTSQAILDLNNHLKYTICDIPPSLFISYSRLKRVYKNKKIGLLYSLNEDEINNEISKYDISFIMPHQLNFLRNTTFDLTIAIDCLMEMNKKIINYYFSNINRLSKLFYFSIPQKKSVTNLSKLVGYESFDYNKNDYNVPLHWKIIEEKNSIFPSNYLSCLYSMKKQNI